MTAATLIAMLLQDPPSAGRPATYSATSLAMRLGTDWRGQAPTGIELGTPTESGTESFSSAGCDVLWTAIDAPVPDDMEQMARHSRLWPTDAPGPTNHARHTIVMVRSDDPDSTNLRGLATLLTQVVTSLIALDDSIVAVLWNPAEHLVLPAAFRELALADLPAPVLHAWVAFNVAPDPGGNLTGHTRGLRSLGLMDIEVPSTHDTPQALLDRLRGLTQYLFDNGMTIKDGDTVGASDRERIVARHLPSALDPEVTVLTLIDDRAGAKKRGFLRRG
ncbi:MULTISPECIES: DUF4261 domain-containing protein [unclassified Nocardioides]|uniref:DUF4261 domain-containing protein n=1 Tax=unclassified Nocardioides TaxID=2615069 RepID=UPI0006FD5982|nr:MULTISPECIES: DUF4261 domain-containing protein [unclassified Nocardioides]KRA39029.1 hypothetical protein ASD81_10750 [Nocardioides sp. Root614]KRA92988.1 hypothetical protein ASD84_11015 [Nocardioides sp. Root682]